MHSWPLALSKKNIQLFWIYNFSRRYWYFAGSQGNEEIFHYEDEKKKLKYISTQPELLGGSRNDINYKYYNLDI